MNLIFTNDEGKEFDKASVNALLVRMKEITMNGKRWTADGAFIPTIEFFDCLDKACLATTVIEVSDTEE